MNRLAFTSQELGAESMECRYENTASAAAGQGIDAFLHFLGGLVREGDARICQGGTDCAIKCAIRDVMTRVFPEPAPPTPKADPGYAGPLLSAGG